MHIWHRLLRADIIAVWHRVTHHIRRIHCLQYTSQRIDVADTGIQVLSGLNGMVGFIRKDIEEVVSTFKRQWEP